MAPKRVARGVKVVLEQVDASAHALGGQARVGLRGHRCAQALARAVVGHEVGDRAAFGSRVLGMGADVEVEPGTVG